MKISRIKRISKDSFLWEVFVLLTFPHMDPRYFDQFPTVNLVFTALRLGSFFIVLIWYIYRKKISPVILLIGIQQLYLFVITFLNLGNTFACATMAFNTITVAMLYDIQLDNKKMFLSAQMLCFEIVIYINLFTEIAFPEGMWVTAPSSTNMHWHMNNWFLGYYNNHSQYYIPALLIAMLYRDEFRKNLRPIMLISAIFIAALLVHSGGVLVSLFSMLIAYVFLKNKTGIFNYCMYWLIQIEFFLGVIVMKFQNLLRPIVENVLGKWNSLVLRQQLWDRNFELLKGTWIFGNGVKRPIEREMENGFHWAMHAHNQLLETLYQGGIINLLLFICIIVVAGKWIYKYRGRRQSKIISIAFLGWILATLVEPFATPFLMAMFVVAYRQRQEIQIE